MTGRLESLLWSGYATALAVAVFNFISMAEQIAGMNNFALTTRDAFYVSSAAFVVFSLSLAYVRRNVWLALIPVVCTVIAVAWIVSIIPRIVPV